MNPALVELFDTHCHIHFNDYDLDKNQVLADARAAGVSRMICVGTTLVDSAAAIEFAASRDNIWASVGVHPHEADDFLSSSDSARELSRLSTKNKVVAIGEIGLDYYYQNSAKAVQLNSLKTQISIGIGARLPFIFHVRDDKDSSGKVWQDFWEIIDSYKGIRGVVHSFSATKLQLEQVLNRGLYVGLNGIMTFTRDENQLAAAKSVPLDKIVLETDAPFLAPKPFRGKICQPKYIADTARFLAGLRGESYESLAKVTTNNALELFRIN